MKDLSQRPIIHDVWDKFGSALFSQPLARNRCLVGDRRVGYLIATMRCAYGAGTIHPEQTVVPEAYPFV